MIASDRESRQRIGQIKSHVAAAPFYVSDSVLLYETPASSHPTPQGIVEEPLKLRALDLKTGKELWTRNLRDTTRRLLSPP